MSKLSTVTKKVRKVLIHLPNVILFVHFCLAKQLIENEKITKKLGERIERLVSMIEGEFSSGHSNQSSSFTSPSDFSTSSASRVLNFDDDIEESPPQLSQPLQLTQSKSQSQSSKFSTDSPVDSNQEKEKLKDEEKKGKKKAEVTFFETQSLIKIQKKIDLLPKGNSKMMMSS